MIYYHMNNKLIRKSLLSILILTILITSLLYLTRIIHDPDFFWHLKTGEWIWSNKSLPSQDPFSYTTPHVYSSREQFILTSYWLSQVIFYLSYLAGGLSGIVFLRFIMIGILIYTMIKLKKGDNLLYASLLLIFLTLLFKTFPVERPHYFSFLFFAALLCLLEKQVKAEVKIEEKDEVEVKVKKGLNLNLNLNLYLNLSLLPLLMLVWANMHGGYLLGQAVIILYLVMEGIKFLSPTLMPVKKEAYRKLLISGILGIVFSLINPNTYHALIETMSVPSFNILEYVSSIKKFKTFNDYTMLLYWFLLLLTITGLIANIKKINITELMLIAGTGYFSFTQMRYIPFFMIAALPVIGRSLSSKNILLKISRVLILIIAIFSSLYFSWGERFNIKNLKSGGLISNYLFPVDAVEFITSNNLRGNMYNFYDWGGFLIWALAPERKVFIDGRTLNADIFSQSILIDNAWPYTEKMTGLPIWKSTLNAYNVNYIAIPLFYSSGDMLPLVPALLNDREWRPVFFQKNSMIFVKDSPENYKIIYIYSIPRDYFIDALINGCDDMTRNNPQYFFPYIAKGDFYLSQRKFKEAREAYERVLKIAPFNPTAKERLKSLDTIMKNNQH